MRQQANQNTSICCSCGSVEFNAQGNPIITSICYCDDCQKASHQIESLPNAPHILREDGGTSYILYRKDRITCLRGDQLLVEYRLDDKAKTKRVIASCCHSAMFLDFERGHWLSLYTDRFQGNVPPVEMLIQTKYKPGKAVLPGGIPEYSGFSFKFLTRLMLAKLGMMVGR